MRSLLQSLVVLFQFVSNYKLSRSRHNLRKKKKEKKKRKNPQRSKPINSPIKNIKYKLWAEGAASRHSSTVSFYAEINTNTSCAWAFQSQKYEHLKYSRGITSSLQQRNASLRNIPVNFPQ